MSFGSTSASGLSDRTSSATPGPSSTYGRGWCSVRGRTRPAPPRTSTTATVVAEHPPADNGRVVVDVTVASGQADDLAARITTGRVVVRSGCAGSCAAVRLDPDQRRNDGAGEGVRGQQRPGREVDRGALAEHPVPLTRRHRVQRRVAVDAGGHQVDGGDDVAAGHAVAPRQHGLGLADGGGQPGCGGPTERDARDAHADQGGAPS